MGKTRHPNSSPYIRHVRYTTKHTSRGPILVKRLLKEATFVPRARSRSPTHQGHFHDDNDHSYHGSGASKGGKVLLAFCYIWSTLTLFSNAEPE